MHKNNFDLIRFGLAFTVIISHLYDLSLHPDLKFVKSFFNSHIAVTGFFILSGFLVARSFDNTNDIKKYFLKRANRLLPGYIFTVCISALLLMFFSKLSFNQYFASKQLYMYLASNLSFMNFLQPCLPGVFTENQLCAVNGALWTIKVEVGFYLIVPVIIYLLRKVKHKVILLLAIYILSITYYIGLSYYAAQTNSNIVSILAHQLPAFMSYFACGIFMHYYLADFMIWKNRAMLIAMPVLIIEYLCGIEVLTPMALTVVLFYIAYSLPQFNGFGKHGDISYGIYIYHFPLIQLAVSIGLFKTYNPYLVSIVIIAVVLILATISWHLLEKGFVQKKFTVNQVNQSAKKAAVSSSL